MGALKVCILISCAYVVSSQVTSRDVVIDQGTVRGYNTDNEDVFSYYGIPFATAPQGEDRFKAPLPPPTWTDVFNATARNVFCPQRFTQAEPTLDCLVVHVFAPVTNETKLPVFVYIHGGGLRGGSGQEYSPVELATKGVVGVTFNYRIGAYGFLCLGTEFAPGNAGFKDQSAALAWVHKNIAQFGGDPDNVLIAGSSAGGISVELQVLSPMSNGLFHKASLESGTTVSGIGLSLDPIAFAERYARESYGVETGRDVQLLEEFYKSLPDEELNNMWLTRGPDMGFLACIETHNLEGVDKFLEAAPIDIILSENYEKRPLLSGFTIMEGLGFINEYDSSKPLMEEDFSPFLPVDLFFDSESDRLNTAQKIKDFYFPTGEVTYEGFIDFYTDTIFLYPHVLSARLHTQNSVPVFLYLWSFNGTVNVPGMEASPIQGPGHIAQSLYLLQHANSAVYDRMTSEDFLLKDRIQEIYLNFVKYGEPIPSRTQLLDAEWLPVTSEADNYLDIDVELTFSQSPFRERFEFWEEIYDRNF